MSTVRSYGIAAVLFVLLVCSRPASAAEHLVEVLPNDALGFVTANRLAETSDKVSKIAQLVQAPVPNPLLFLKLQASIQHGLDEKGSLALVLMRNPEKTNDFFPVLFLPVTNYKQFVTQFGAQEPDAKIVKVPVAEQDVLIGKRGSFAVFAQVERHAALEKILDEKAQVSPQLAILKSWLDSNDVNGVITTKGIELLAQQAKEELEKASSQFNDPDLPPGPEFESIKSVFKLYSNFAQLLGQEITLFSAGIRINNAGDVHLVTRTALDAKGELSKLAGTSRAVDATPLAKLPNKRFVLAGNFELTPGLGDATARLMESLLTNSPLIYGFSSVDKKEAQQFAKMTSDLFQQIQSVAIAFDPGKKEEPVLAGYYGIVEAKDPKKVLDIYEKWINDWTKLQKNKKPNNPPNPVPNMQPELSVVRQQIAGKPGLKITMDYSAVMQGPAGMMFSMFFERIFGPGGKPTAYLVAIDQKHVMLNYIDKKRIEEMVNNPVKKEGSLVQRKELAATEKRLQQGGQWTLYISPNGISTFVARMVSLFDPQEANKIPVFPETPAVGASLKFGKQTIDSDLVVPTEIIREIRGYIQDVEAAANN